MFNKKLSFLYLLFGVCVLGGVALVFYRSMGALPFTARALFVCVVVFVFAFAGWYASQALRQLGKAKYWLSGATLLFGLFLLSAFEPKSQSIESANVSYSDGKQIENVKPEVVDAWGRLANGYNLHPAYSDAVVRNALAATFLSQPKEIKLLFTKPSYALYQSDGKPTQSDGISVDLKAFDKNGHLGYSNTLTIPQKDFLNNKWVEKSVSMDAGIASIQVTVGTGPPGSTPYFDSTVVVFKISSAYDYFEFLGVVILVCIGFFVVALSLVMNFGKFFDGFKSRGKKISFFTCFNFLLFFACLVLVAYWCESRSVSVYYWDSRNYWEKTEVLYELLKAGLVMQAISTFLTAYAGEYSNLPAIGPALLSLITGSPTRVNYTLSITMLYAVPAYIMLAYIAKCLVNGGSLAYKADDKSWWILASFPVFFGLSNYFGTTLLLMPDIGGVVLYAGALLSAFTLVKAIQEEGPREKPWQISSTIVRSSITLGALFSLMFIFRRWYIFAVVGMAVAVLIIVLVDIVRAKFARDIIFRAVSSAILIAFAVLPFLSWILFAWSRDFGQHDYSNLYASYRFPLSRDIEVFKVLFGFAVPLLCIVGGVLLYFVGKAKRLLFLLTFSTCMAWLLFYYVQSPSRHHFLLLMPMFGVFLAGLSMILARRFGFMAAVGLTLILVLGGGLATRGVSDKYHNSFFASFNDWLPQQQVYKDGYIALSHWLVSPDNVQKKFCVIASDGAINQGIFTELWQIMPGASKHAYDQRLVSLGQVDTVDGPPKPPVRDCEIFLVGVPFLSHLRPGQQFTLEIIQQDMINGTGIGSAVDRTPTVFPMGDNVEIRAYQRVRNITDAEYDNLVKRFLDSKASQETQP